ncbi:MAG: metallophosphoesterase [Candidatus Omnitrophica bacterium]|nr:metallophosphoesterase [Candidatus Omnitrophota bacterium]MCB9781763.1 metallophosphoesterase [Candidatus Omnitrophota bacterium]
MKILVVADLHYSLPQLDWLEKMAEEIDLLIIAGDLLDLAGFADLDTQIVVVRKYLERLRAKTKVFVCSGNHDGDVRNEGDEVVAEWLQKARRENLFVDGDGFDFGKGRITVLPWWDGPITRGQMVEILDRETAESKTCWFLIHHAPPNESPISRVRNSDQGDAFFRETLLRLKPDFAFSGHIHNPPFSDQGSWIDKIGSTWVFNPGKQLGPFPSHIMIDLETMKAQWTSVYGIEEANLNGEGVELAAP